MYDVCTIGHITLDKVVTPQSVKFMPGGTSFYFSKAIQSFDINYALVTALGSQESYIVDDLRKEGIEVTALDSDFTVHFENIYSQNQDHRDQNVLHTAASFDVPKMPAIEAKIFHLGPLLANDISVDLIKFLASKGEVSLDVQGFLRDVKDKKVHYQDWEAKKEALPFITYLKANEVEMKAITGTSDVQKGSEYLAEMGVKEVIITLGSKGSVVYTKGAFFEIPAYEPEAVIDATGCGDTYMAGYLLQRVKGESVQQAGEFGAAMASLKIAGSGPFTGSIEDVKNLMDKGAVTYQIIGSESFVE